MNRVGDNSVSPGGDLDALLGAYFKGKLPRSWPAFQPPRPQPLRSLPLKPAKRRPRFAFGSRLALAASVFVLLLCGWLLADKFPGPAFRPDLPSLSEPNANSRHRQPSLAPDEQGTVPSNLPGPGEVKSDLRLEQDAAGTGVRVIVEEVKPKK